MSKFLISLLLTIIIIAPIAYLYLSPFSYLKMWKGVYNSLGDFVFSERMGSGDWIFVHKDNPETYIRIDYYDMDCFVCHNGEIVLYSTDNKWMSKKVAKHLLKMHPELNVRSPQEIAADDFKKLINIE